MKDYIEIKGLKVWGHHGVLNEEKENGQDFIIDLKLFTDLSPAGISDDLKKTVNYADVSVLANSYVSGTCFDLIEKVAEGLAKEILANYPLIDSVNITIHKPQAPIPVSFEDVSVNITRGWHIAYISIGSNIGDKRGYINEALCKLEKASFVRKVASSKLIETEPYGGVEQDIFLNGAIRLETLLTPQELLCKLHEIENEAGRTREIHWGPRTLDLDIIFYDRLIMSTDKLVIPHPDMQNRAFVLQPLMELCPNYVNPANGKSVAVMLNELQNRDI